MHTKQVLERNSGARQTDAVADLWSEPFAGLHPKLQIQDVQKGSAKAF